MADQVQRRLAAILAADVAGYSRLMGEDEEGTLAALTAHRIELIEPCITEHRGRVVKTAGDGLLAEFASVVDAVRCAVAFQEGILQRNAAAPDDRRIEFRIGVNLGDVIVQDDDVFGDAVNVASRLESLAEPGGIVVSGKVHDEVLGKIPLSFTDLGPQKVKNIARPVPAFAARVRDEAAMAMAAPLPLPDKPSIAVLPFENMSGDLEQEYFADGIAEDLITNLSRFHWFFVIARNSSFTFKGRAADVKQVARELGVQYVLEGSVRKSGNRVRITAQLIDALNGRHIWAERYDRELGDIFAVQDEITEAIIGAAAPSFVTAEDRRVVRKAPEDLNAWDLVMRGNAVLWHGDRKSVFEARRLFEQAVKLDPGNATALSGITMSYGREVVFGWGENPRATREAAYRAAQSAIAAEAENAWAHAASGFVFTLMRDHHDAIRAGRKALDLNPNLAFAEGVLAVSYAHLGDAQNALLHADRADRQSPRDLARASWTVARIWAAFIERDYAKGAEWAQWVIETNPELPIGWRHLAANLAQLGRLDEANAAVAELSRRFPDINIRSTREFTPVPQPELLERFLEGLRKAGLPE